MNKFYQRQYEKDTVLNAYFAGSKFRAILWGKGS